MIRLVTVAVAITLYTIAVSPRMTLLGGIDYFLPALVLLAAAHGQWRNWLIWLIAFGVTRFFTASPVALLILVLVFSGLAYLFFQRWIDQQEPWMNILASSLLLVGFIVADAYLHLRAVPLATLGSVVLTLPLAWVWYAGRSSSLT